MKTKLPLILAILFVATTVGLNAQKFLRPFEMISHKKPTYITLEDGTVIEGRVKKLKRKKGLIKEINITTESGEKKTIPIESIKHAYLPQSGLDKVVRFDDFISDATQWDDGLHDKERIKEGYAIFEKKEVKVKKKKMTLLMQLLNPGTCERIRVYHDPMANETAGLGMAGIQVSGGNDKSYYVQKDDNMAYRFSKKDFRKNSGQLIGDCKKVMSSYSKMKWSEFEQVVFTYNEICRNNS